MVAAHQIKLAVFSRGLNKGHNRKFILSRCVFCRFPVARFNFCSGPAAGAVAEGADGAWHVLCLDHLRGALVLGITYASDGEMAAALADLNRQIAGATDRISVVRIQSSKGL